MHLTVTQGLILDLVVILATTALALGHVIPGEAALGIISMLSGAKIVRGGFLGGGGAGGAGGAGGTSSQPPPLPPSRESSSPTSLRIGDVSIAAAIGVALLALFIPHHRGA